MNRAEKQAFIDSFNAQLADAAAVVVTHYRGLTVQDMEKLRASMREDEATIRVVKNRLALRALEGTPYKGQIDEFMTGPTAVAFSADPVAAAKVAHTFAKSNDNLVVLGGAMGDKKLSAEEVKELASLPSLDELRAKLVGLITAPATRIATYSQEPAAKLARVLAQRGAQSA